MRCSICMRRVVAGGCKEEVFTRNMSTTRSAPRAPANLWVDSHDQADGRAME
jgi:hypothetical protein